MNFKLIEDISCKDYKSFDVETDAAENFPGIRDVMHDTQYLHSDNREAFRQLFGLPVFYYTSEFRFHCYPLDLDDLQILLLTAKGKGTSYEVIVRRNDQKIRKNMDTLVKFLKDLDSSLKEIKNG